MHRQNPSTISKISKIILKLFSFQSKYSNIFFHESTFHYSFWGKIKSFVPSNKHMGFYENYLLLSRAVNTQGARGAAAPQFMADQLTLFKQRGADYAQHITT